jgi:ATP-dependent DNA helicase RecQ
VRLLYVAPERFRASGVVTLLERAPLQLLAIDEAHCISEWGHDFRPDYARLGEVVARLSPPRLVALTATATPEVRRQIAASLQMETPFEIVRGFDRPNLSFAVQRTLGERDKLVRLLRLLDQPGAKGAPALVYAATRKKAAEVARALVGHGIAAAAYHAGLEDGDRDAVQEAFMAGRVRVVVATNAFGMGVDKRDVRLVVHHDLPGSIEAYYQEAGRAGRDGAPARCVLLFHHADVRLREFLIENGDVDGVPRSPERVAAERARLRSMMAYAYGRGCRRRALLDHFGDPESVRCDERPCDVCASTAEAPPLSSDELLVVRKVLAFVARVDGSYGRQRLALGLIGSTSREVTSARLDTLSTFGVLAGRSPEWALDLLGTLEAAGLIEAQGATYPVLSLTRLGRDVMHGRIEARMNLPSERELQRGRGGARTASRVAESRPARARRSERTAGRGDAERPSEDEEAGLSGPEEERFGLLRARRAELARASGVPPYVIAHDRTLRALARAAPRTQDELLAIPGMGVVKAARYGEALLEALSRS